MLAKAVAVAFVLLFPLIFGPADAEDEIFGIWRDPAMQADVFLYACDDGLCGDLVRLPEKAARQDLKNPDPAKRGRNLLGLTVIDGFHRIDRSGSMWIGGGDQGRLPGRIYVPTNGDTLGDAANTYVISLTSKDTLTIGIDNCLFSCLASYKWFRVGGDDRPRTSRQSGRN
ncbi:MAG: DUF2147 domain-containing protein [Alphaproteobacteria bacterium]